MGSLDEDLFVINTFNMQNLCDSLALLLYCDVCQILHKLFTIRVHVNFYKMSLENVLSQL